jgi:hypothetical protein
VLDRLLPQTRGFKQVPQHDGSQGQQHGQEQGDRCVLALLICSCSRCNATTAS